MSVDRAVSTVMDVAMALLLISASILLIGIHLHNSDDELDENRADRTGELLGESTISVQYSLEDAAPIADREGEYRRSEYGSATGLLADAAVANVQVDGTRIRPAGDEFETAVGASVESALIGSNRHFYVIAEWEPYDGASINGTATAGERPPPNEDVSSVTLTASSGIPAVDSNEVETAYVDADAYEAVGMVIGDAIVDGYFPPAATQRSLESQGLSHELTVSQYERMVKPLEYEFTGTTAPAHHGPLKREEADAVEANAQVVRGIADADTFGRSGLGHWLGEDLQTALADEIATIEEQYDGKRRDEEIAALLADEVSTDEVTITIQTWYV